MRRLTSLVLFLSLSAFARGDPRRPTPANPAPRASSTTAAATQPIRGELTAQDGLPILRVWGTAHERGYAHGWLLAADILQMLDRFLADERLSGGPAAYRALALPMAALMSIPEPFAEELHGMLAGIRDRLGPDRLRIDGLDRPLDFVDLVAINCASDRLRQGCSSFAVWGPHTRDGHTLTGRNLDWHASPALDGNQLLLVQMPDDENHRLGWAGVTWPGFIGALTAMNEHGVTLAIHDVPAGPPDRLTGLTPRPLVFRELIEGRGRSGVHDFEEAETVLRKHMVPTGSNVLISRPFHNGLGRAAAVFEYDGQRERHAGLAVREPTAGSSLSWIACTNHYRDRRAPGECDRYGVLVAAIDRSGHSDAAPWTIERAWDLLSRVAQPKMGAQSLRTYQTVVFEPNEKRMHVAVSVGGRPAPECRRVTISVAPSPRECLVP